LNGLIILKPPAFWWGAIFAGVIAAAYALLALHMFLRRLYAVPILVFEPGLSVSQTIRQSIERSRGTIWRCAGTIAILAAIVSLLTAAVLGLLQVVLQSILRSAGASLATAVLLAGTALIINALVATILSVMANMTFTGFVLSLYRDVAPPGALDQYAAAKAPARVPIGWILGGVLAAVAAFSTVYSVWAIHDQKLHDVLEITAHRAGAAGAPENTVVALK
jgi:glycerophosphoryl diester phosphodiesterase